MPFRFSESSISLRMSALRATRKIGFILQSIFGEKRDWPHSEREVDSKLNHRPRHEAEREDNAPKSSARCPEASQSGADSDSLSRKQIAHVARARKRARDPGHP